jgi:hypothetical protein
VSAIRGASSIRRWTGCALQAAVRNHLEPSKSSTDPLQASKSSSTNIVYLLFGKRMYLFL